MPDAATRIALAMRTLPLAFRFAPDTFDATARTVELVWTTGAAVPRDGFRPDGSYGPWVEELSLEPGACDLSRLNAGAPLLNAHCAWDVEDVLGRVMQAWIIDAAQGRAKVMFSSRDDVAPVMQDVRDGILCNVSAGYWVQEYTVTVVEGQAPIYRATKWQPAELSLVPIPADAGAGTRAAPPSQPCTIHRAPAHNPGETMTTTPAAAPAPADTPAVPAVAPAATPAPDTRAAPAGTPAATVQPADVAEITRLVRGAKLSDAFALELAGVKPGLPIDQVRARILDKLAETSDAGQVRNVEVIRDELDTTHSLIENALLHRAMPGDYKLVDGARQFMGLSLLEMVGDYWQGRGMKLRGLTRMQRAAFAFGPHLRDAISPDYARGGGMMTTSDFSNILANIANKTLRKGYEEAPRTFLVWASPSSTPDFKQIARTQLSAAPNLLKVAEHGEYQRASMSDGKEVYQLATFGRIISVSRQAIINDDLQAFTRLPRQFGQAASRMESDTVYGILTTNANMADGVALFHASHGNLQSAESPNVGSFGTAKAAMRNQKGLQKELLNLEGAFIILPSELETLGLQYTSANYQPNTPANQNPFAGRLQPVIEGRLSASSASRWYMAASPGQVDTVEYCYLEGEQGVFTEQRPGFEVDGLEIKVREDFAAKALDHRGLQRIG